MRAGMLRMWRPRTVAGTRRVTPACPAGSTALFRRKRRELFIRQANYQTNSTRLPCVYTASTSKPACTTKEQFCICNSIRKGPVVDAIAPYFFAVQDVLKSRSAQHSVRIPVRCASVSRVESRCSGSNAPREWGGLGVGLGVGPCRALRRALRPSAWSARHYYTL